MPSVVGKPYAKAAAALDGAGLHVQRASVHSSTTAAGIVVRQSEPAGNRVAKGNTVVLTVSSGPRFVTIRASDFLGRKLADVQRELTSEHLRVAVTRSPSAAAAGTVTAVAPTGAVREGSTVTVTVAAAPAPGPEHKGPKKHDHGD